MVISRWRPIGIALTAALAFAALVVVSPTGDAGADTSSDARDFALNYESIKFVVDAGERARHKVVCSDGVVDGMRWRVAGTETAPPELKVVTKVSKNQRAGFFVADATKVSSLLLPAVQLKAVVVCFVGQDPGGE